MTLVFATNNRHKLKEVQAMLGKQFNLQTLQDIGCETEVPETQNTIEGNASQKAQFVFEHYHKNCFADDTGLEIEALNGEPGVKSARYAGEERNNERNIDLVLKRLANKTNRQARFKTVISLMLDGQESQFEGLVNGTILFQRSGTNGFGYDAIFLPDGYSKSFAELSANEKNKISHRAIAFEKLIKHLKK